MGGGVDLAAAYRLVALYGWDDLIFTHFSARVPGPEHHFLINPYDMMFEEIPWPPFFLFEDVLLGDLLEHHVVRVDQEMMFRAPARAPTGA